MKKLLYFIICITLFSCSKNPSTPSGTTASGSIQYKVNGNLVVMDNVDLLTGQFAIFYKRLKGSLFDSSLYQCNAQKGANSLLSFAIVADSLQKINYHLDSTSTVRFFTFVMFNGNESALFYNGDYFDINITSYKDSKISGTFTAKFSPVVGIADYNTRGTTIITEGVINNVQVVY